MRVCKRVREIPVGIGESVIDNLNARLKVTTEKRIKTATIFRQCRIAMSRSPRDIAPDIDIQNTIGVNREIGNSQEININSNVDARENIASAKDRDRKYFRAR